MGLEDGIGSVSPGRKSGPAPAPGPLAGALLSPTIGMLRATEDQGQQTFAIVKTGQTGQETQAGTSNFNVSKHNVSEQGG